MSATLHPTPLIDRPTPAASRALARGFTIDPRIPAAVPGFDAPFFQAGLAGYSDAAMRLVARRHGCPYAVTEALLDRVLVGGGKGRRREAPDLLAAECGTGDPEENRAAGLEDHPIAGQLMGTLPDEMGEGAAILAGMGYDVIDVNFACPVKAIKKASRGGDFLKQPKEAREVLRAVRAAVPAHVPTTVKLRRSWDDTPEMVRHFEQIFADAYELGYAWATVHCRTVEQRYVGSSHWSFLRGLVDRNPGKVIFGSGDIWDADDIFAMLEATGVHAVSVARGCIGNPWLFRQARQLMAGTEPTAPTLAEQRGALVQHFDFAMELHGEGAVYRRMRKAGIKFARHHEREEAVKEAFIRCRNLNDWQGVIERHYAG